MLTHLADSPWTDAAWVTGSATVFCWYWLIRMPRCQPPPEPQVTHVVHHHVLHGGEGAAALPWAGWAEIPAPGPQAIPGPPIPALEAPPAAALASLQVPQPDRVIRREVER